MTPERFVQCLEAIHWSTDQLASIFECDEGLTEAWSLGLDPIPPKAAAWLEALAAVHESLASEKPKSLKGQKAGWPKRYDS